MRSSLYYPIDRINLRVKQKRTSPSADLVNFDDMTEFLA
jgi:hypothetical protein